MRIIAYFLPQFYSIPENDKYWGENFTDWVNAKNAKQYFPDHRSPLFPTLFGYYDLSDKETIKLLCDYSIDKGVDGFAYWHYWFGDKKQALEKVPEEHLRNTAIKQNFFSVGQIQTGPSPGLEMRIQLLLNKSTTSNPPSIILIT